MIAAGALILLFVAYQLWGTGLQTAQAQEDLEAEFEQQLAEAEAATTTSTTEPDDTTSTTTDDGGEPPSTLPPLTAPPIPPPQPGEPAGRLEIADIGLDVVFVEGVRVSDLRQGPGHYPGTPLPGQAGNAAIAGHRTTYGAPFNRLDELTAGDEIVITTVQGRFVYEVREQVIVSPRQNDVLGPSTADLLTLTSCHPKFSARERLIVVAELQGEPVAEEPTRAPADDDGQAAATLEEPDVSGEAVPRLPAIIWAGVCVLIAAATWLLARKWKRWPAYLIGTPLFLVALFVFFENFNRLLPANY
jgi:sortase A